MGPKMDPPMEVVKFQYVHSRDTNGARLARGGVTLAVERRSSDGRVLVAMVKCPEHKVFDESRGRHAAQIKFNAGYYTVTSALQARSAGGGRRCRASR